MFVKGASTAQAGEIVETLTGVKLSPSAVSRVHQTLQAEFDAWKQRPLLTHYLYVFAAGTYFTVITKAKATKRLSRPSSVSHRHSCPAAFAHIRAGVARQHSPRQSPWESSASSSARPVAAPAIAAINQHRSGFTHRELEHRRPYSPMICATTSRWRGRVSKSMRIICCHVPKVRRPSIKGTLNDGPSRAARTWLWPLSSPQRR